MKKICISCGRFRTYLKARQLCESCWTYAKSSGHLHEFPTKAERMNAVPGRCRCYQPIEEPIPPWGVQCLKCKRPIIT